MRTAIFMMPTWGMTNGVPLDYKFEERNCDRRTAFYRAFANREISVYNAVRIAEELGMQVFRKDGKLTRILAPNGKTAEAFYKRMTSLGYRK